MVSQEQLKTFLPFMAGLEGVIGEKKFQIENRYVTTPPPDINLASAKIWYPFLVLIE